VDSLNNNNSVQGTMSKQLSTRLQNTQSSNAAPSVKEAFIAAHEQKTNLSGITLDLRSNPDRLMISVLEQNLSEQIESTFPNVKLKISSQEQYKVSEQYQVPEQYQSPISLHQVEQEFVNSVSQQLYYGERNGYDVSEMDQSVHRASQALESGYLKTSDILNDLGFLDKGVSEYLQKSHTRVQDGLNSLKNEYTNGVNKAYSSNVAQRDSFTLRVKTRDGDVIDIQLKYSDEREQKNINTTHILDREISVSYQVEGNLSDAEKEALNELTQGLSSLADRFFAGKGSLTEISGLDMFDSEQLASFSLSLEDHAETSGEGLQKLLVEYSVNQQLFEHTLSSFYNDDANTGAKGEDSYHFDITASLQAAGFDMFGVNGHEEALSAAKNNLALLEQQIDFSTDQLNKKDVRANEFYKSGLKQMFSEEIINAVDNTKAKEVLAEPIQVSMQAFKGIIQSHPKYKELSVTPREKIDEVLSGLPDFIAEFGAKRKLDGTNFGKREMNLTLGQQTETARHLSVGGLVENVEQTDTFKLDITQQELRKLGSERVVERIEIDRETTQKAEYLNGILTSQQEFFKQTAEQNVSHFFENPVSYLTKERTTTPLDANFEKLNFVRLLREMSELFTKE